MYYRRRIEILYTGFVNMSSELKIEIICERCNASIGLGNKHITALCRGCCDDTEGEQ